MPRIANERLNQDLSVYRLLLSDRSEELAAQMKALQAGPEGLACDHRALQGSA